MACLYLSYLKQSLGQTLFYKILSHPKTILFPLISQKLHLLPIYIFFSCLLCNLYFKINFCESFEIFMWAGATN
jgi:hypothetical protein